MLRHHVDALMARAFPVDFEDAPLLLCGFWLHQEGAIIVPLGRRYPSRINLECKGFVSKRNRHRIMARQRDVPNLPHASGYFLARRREDTPFGRRGYDDYVE